MAKYTAERPAIFELTKSMTHSMAMVSSVRGTSSTNRLTRVMTMVTREFIIWGMVWLMTWRRVSTSLVYTDIMSPWAWVSKYWMGRDSIWVNKSSRRLRMVPWLMFTIIRL